MRYYIGIDFGTTTSSVSYTTDKSTMGPELVEIDGKKTINTAIRLAPDGKSIEMIGNEAWDYYQEEPDRTFVEFKMDVGLGKKYVRKAFTITPEEVGVVFLTFLRERVERQFGGATLASLDIKGGVTTVVGYPTEWSKNQKKAVENMVRQAGFPNVEGGSEPLGAVYYHGMNGEIDINREHKVLVYDFGGGTSDIAIVALSPSLHPHVYDFDGLTNVGGRNYDNAIIEEVFKPLFDSESYSVPDLAEFQRKAQSLKERLSSKIIDGFDTAEVHLSGLNCMAGSSMNVSLTRQKFEEIAKKYMDQFLTPVSSTLQQTGFPAKDIFLAIATGGSARLYFVDGMLRKALPNSTYLRSNNPQEVIAKGLAIYGRRASQELRKATSMAEDGVVPDVEISSTSNPANQVPPSQVFPNNAGGINPFDKQKKFKKITIAVFFAGMIAALLLWLTLSKTILKPAPPPPPPPPSSIVDSAVDVMKSIKSKLF